MAVFFDAPNRSILLLHGELMFPRTFFRTARSSIPFPCLHTKHNLCLSRDFCTLPETTCTLYALSSADDISIAIC